MSFHRTLRLGSACLLATGLGLAAGCRSAVSTHVSQDPSGTIWETKKIRGIPITLKLPTHLEVRIIERRYLNPETGTPLPGPTCAVLVTKHVEYAVKEQDEVFLVDSVRPASGKLTYESTFQGQSFKTFNTKIEDTTIEDITNVVKALPGLKKGNTKSAASISTVKEQNIVEIDKVIAVKVFPVRDPNLECEVQLFVNQYLNDCAEACKPAKTCDPR